MAAGCVCVNTGTTAARARLCGQDSMGTGGHSRHVAFQCRWPTSRLGLRSIHASQSGVMESWSGCCCGRAAAHASAASFPSCVSPCASPSGASFPSGWGRRRRRHERTAARPEQWPAPAAPPAPAGASQRPRPPASRPAHFAAARQPLQLPQWAALLAPARMSRRCLQRKLPEHTALHIAPCVLRPRRACCAGFGH